MRIRLTFLSIVILFAAVLLSVPTPVRADGFVVLPCNIIGVAPLPAQVPTLEAPAPASVRATPTPIGFPPVPPRPPSPIRPPECTAYLSVKNHNVNVTINNQVAKTRVDEVFVNDSDASLEGTYIFPLPDDASVSDFAMWVDGKRLEGQVLDKTEARRIYEDIVRTRKDPALLEYIGRNAFQARIFPIPPHSEKRVEIEYVQVLMPDNGLVRYVYPLNTEKFSPKPLQRVSINVEVQSKSELKAIYSPSHSVSVSRDGNYAAKIGYEDSNVRPDRDFILYYSVSSAEIGLNLVSYKPMGEDGYFVLLVAPPLKVADRQVIAKDVILVLDTSGSMQGAKIDQAKKALGYILDQLNGGDRFNIIGFNTGTTTFSSKLEGVEGKEKARAFVSNLRAEGSTDINRALLEALRMADKERPTTVIFLTDGLPTAGETSAQRIISSVSGAAAKNIRLFTFGVGDDVNTILLDTLAEKIRGASRYVRPNEKIDEVVTGFYTLISTPVLADISIDWGGMSVSDIYPYPLPDLFAGSQLVVAGRYRSGGPTTITLKGKVNGTEQQYMYSDISFNADSSHSSAATDFAARLWATRKIGYLLNQVRLNGESRETISEIVSLAVRYGIVTPYTSFLVDERKDVLTESGRNGAAQDMQKSFTAPGAMPTSGAAAVQQSQQQNQLRGANVAPAVPTTTASSGSGGQSSAAGPLIQLVGDRTFVLRNGVWTDTMFDPSKTTTRKIEFNSDAYFKFITQFPPAAKFMALGSRVILVMDGVAYEFTSDGSGATIGNAAPLPTAGQQSSLPAENTTPVAAPAATATIASQPAENGIGVAAVSWPVAVLAGGGLVAGTVLFLRRRK